jgi:hypothetical protein
MKLPNFELEIDTESITDLNQARKAIIQLYHLVEELSSENRKQREEIQRFRDEIALLKGEKPKPTIKGKNNKQSANISSEQERRETGKEKKKKGSKKETLTITRTEIARVDKATLPQDAEFKGHETVVVQDIVIKAEVIAFQKEVYYSPSLKKTFTGKLPAGFQGTFGPQLKAFIILLKAAGNTTEPKITALLNSFHIQIGGSSVDRILVTRKQAFHKEKEAIFIAGLESTRYQHIDDTSHRVSGVNYHTHVICNPFFTAFFTTEKKDRLTVLDILNSFSPRTYLFNREAYGLMTRLHVPDVTIWTVQQKAPDSFLNQEAMDTLLKHPSLFPEKNNLVKARILEAAAIAAYHAQRERPIVQMLLADDAPQFKLLTQELALCWIHDGRHYKKLMPIVRRNQITLQKFLKQYWGFYRKLLEYKQQPGVIMTEKLSKEFDELFATRTDFEALNDRIAKTEAKKSELLLVLKYPELPLHNNPAELGARAQVRKRDVSLHTRTMEGTKVQDTFLTIVETAKKLKVNIYDYILDRVSQTYSLPSLASIIQKKSALHTPLI